MDLLSRKPKGRPWWLNALLGLDQFLAALSGQDPDWTVSGALGERQWRSWGGGNIPWRRPLKALLQRSLDRMDRKHCLKAYRTELLERGLRPPVALVMTIQGIPLSREEG